MGEAQFMAWLPKRLKNKEKRSFFKTFIFILE